MTKQAHTPAPWTRDGLRVETSRGCIAECPLPKNGGVFDCQVNADLIAAAPDMLMALDAALNWFSPPNDSKTAFPLKQIAEAVAKARNNSL